MKLFKKSLGFTIMELIIALGLLGVVSVGSGLYLSDSFKDSNKIATKVEVQTSVTALMNKLEETIKTANVPIFNGAVENDDFTIVQLKNDSTKEINFIHEDGKVTVSEGLLKKTTYEHIDSIEITPVGERGAKIGIVGQNGQYSLTATYYTRNTVGKDGNGGGNGGGEDDIIPGPTPGPGGDEEDDVIPVPGEDEEKQQIMYWLTYIAWKDEVIKEVPGVGIEECTFTILDLSSYLESTQDSYKLIGWNTKADGSGTTYKVGDTITLERSNPYKRLYAVFEINYKLVFIADSTSANIKGQNTNIVSSKSQTIEIPEIESTRPGYTIIEGWTLDKEDKYAMVKYKSGDPITLDASDPKRELYAIFGMKLTYNENGGKYAPATQSKRSLTNDSTFTISKSKPIREGYTFKGWDTSEDATTAKYSPRDEITVDRDITLYAVWQPNPYTITFDANGGTGTMADEVAYHNIATSLPGNRFTREGYDFKGWSVNSDGTGKTYWDKGLITLTSNITLYAKWQARTYTVRFDANGGDGSMTNQAFYYNSATNIRENSFTRTGYRFTGWNTKADGSGTAYADKESITLPSASDMRLYAQWEKITYTITYNANGGSGSMTSQTVDKGASVTLKNCGFTKSGYIWFGWATSSDGDPEYINGDIISNITSNITLYASWGKDVELDYGDYVIMDNNDADTWRLYANHDNGIVIVSAESVEDLRLKADLSGDTILYGCESDFAGATKRYKYHSYVTDDDVYYYGGLPCSDTVWINSSFNFNNMCGYRVEKPSGDYELVQLGYFDAVGNAHRESQTYGFRPAIVLKSTIFFRSGSGTASDPWIIGNCLWME